MNTDINLAYKLPMSWEDFHALVMNVIIHLQNTFRHSRNEYYNIRINPSVYHVIKFLNEHGLNEECLCSCIGVSIKHLIDTNHIAVTNWYINDSLKYKIAISRN